MTKYALFPRNIFTRVPRNNLAWNNTLIEMVWRLIRWQPDYPPIKKLRNALLSKRGKRRLIVAAARRLAIDLWRLATGRATAQELGLQLSNPTTQKSTT